MVDSFTRQNISGPKGHSSVAKECTKQVLFWPFWGQNVLPSEAVYHVSYTQEPTNTYLHTYVFHVTSSQYQDYAALVQYTWTHCHCICTHILVRYPIYTSTLKLSTDRRVPVYTAGGTHLVHTTLVLNKFPANSKLQWNLSIKDTLNKGHLSNKDTFWSPNDIELCTNLPPN